MHLYKAGSVRASRGEASLARFLPAAGLCPRPWADAVSENRSTPVVSQSEKDGLFAKPPQNSIAAHAIDISLSNR